MKSILKVLVNILSFGIPLFIEVLSKSRKFTKLVNDSFTVSLVEDHVKISIPRRRGNEMSIILEIDQILSKSEKEERQQ